MIFMLFVTSTFHAWKLRSNSQEIHCDPHTDLFFKTGGEELEWGRGGGGGGERERVHKVCVCVCVCVCVFV